MADHFDEERQLRQPLLTAKIDSPQQPTGLVNSFCNSSAHSTFIVGFVEDEQSTNKTTTHGAIYSLVTTAVGVGILSLPRAMSKAGWFGGTVCLFLAWFFASSSGTMLVRAHEMAEQHIGRSLFRMDEIVEVCTGTKCIRVVVGVVFNFTLVCIGAVMLILLSNSMDYLVPGLTKSAWRVVCFLLLLPIGWLRDMRYISQLAIIGVLVAFLIVILILIDGSRRVVSEGPNLPWRGPAANSSAYGPENIGALGASYSIFVFSYTYSFVIPTLRKNMIHPEEMHTAINKATGFMTFMYAAVAFIGYLAWGVFVKGSVVDSMNWCSMDPAGILPASIKYPGSWACYNLPVCDAFNKDMCLAEPLCKLIGDSCSPRFFAHASFTGIAIATMLVVNCLITYVLVLAPVFKACETESRLIWKPTIPRTLIMLATFIFALCVPYFAEFIQVLSALTLIAFQMYIPVLMIRSIHRRAQKAIPLSDTLCHLTLLMFGTIAMAVGLYSSLNELAEAVRRNPETLYEITHIFEAQFWVRAATH